MFDVIYSILKNLLMFVLILPFLLLYAIAGFFLIPVIALQKIDNWVMKND